MTKAKIFNTKEKKKYFKIYHCSSSWKWYLFLYLKQSLTVARDKKSLFFIDLLKSVAIALICEKARSTIDSDAGKLINTNAVVANTFNGIGCPPLTCIIVTFSSHLSFQYARGSSPGLMLQYLMTLSKIAGKNFPLSPRPSMFKLLVICKNFSLRRFFVALFSAFSGHDWKTLNPVGVIT